MWGCMSEPTLEPTPEPTPAVHYSIAERIREFIQDIEAHVSHAELEVEGWVVSLKRKL